MSIILPPLNEPFFFGVLFNFFDGIGPNVAPTHIVLLFHHAAHPFVMSTRAVAARKSKATQGPKPSNKAQPANRGGQARKTVDEDEEDTTVESKAAPPHLLWNSKRTDRLVQWLEDNVEDCQQLFSDLAQDAKEGGRRCCTAKTSKTSFHLRMAEYIFSVDEDEKIRDYVKLHGAKGYVKAVENHITK